MKSLLIISYSNLKTDSRVRRQIKLLGKLYKTTVVGLGDPHIKNIEFIKARSSNKGILWKLRTTIQLGLCRYESYYWSRSIIKSTLTKLKDRTFDLVLANDPTALPVGLRIAVTSPLLYDAHEYAPEKQANDMIWRILMRPYNIYILRKYLRESKAAVTVSEGLAKAYKENFGCNMDIVMSAPLKSGLRPSKVEQHNIKLVHQGNASRRRNLELMFEILERLDQRFTLDLFLMPTEPDYLEELKKRAKSNNRVSLHPPIPADELVCTINKYDIGICFFPPITFNLENALPNKFFECIQANLAIATGPSKEMSQYVKRYECGVVSESFDPSSMALALNSLNADAISGLKLRSHNAAEELNFENESKKLLAAIRQIDQNE